MDPRFHGNDNKIPYSTVHEHGVKIRKGGWHVKEILSRNFLTGDRLSICCAGIWGYSGRSGFGGLSPFFRPSYLLVRIENNPDGQIEYCLNDHLLFEGYFLNMNLAIGLNGRFVIDPLPNAGISHHVKQRHVTNVFITDTREYRLPEFFSFFA
jgi:hypothetical protein